MMTITERAHACLDDVLRQLAKRAAKEPRLTEATWDDYLRGIDPWNGLGGLRNVLICHYLDNLPTDAPGDGEVRNG